MASANLELVRSLYRAWARGDWSSADWADPEIEVVGVGGPDTISVTGKGELAAAWGEFLGTWQTWRAEAEEFHELGDGRILVLTTWGGSGKASGLAVDSMEARGANLFHVRDGKVTRLVLYWDRARALADAGLTTRGDAA